MKHISFISLLIFTTYIAAMHLSYPLPDEQTITKRLWDAGFSNFAKECRMGAKLHNKSLTPIMTCAAVDDILQEYKNNYPNIIATWDYNSMVPFPPIYPTRSALIRIVLKDYPRAIEALERNQWIESKEKIVGEYRYNWNRKI